MRANKGVLLMSLLLCGVALAAPGASWILGQTPPQPWTVNPVNPGISDTLSFSGPTQVYSNSCVGEISLGGHPMISVDTTSKVVELWFQGPVPVFCPMIYQPVCGLQGQFGPLAAGRWTFLCTDAQVHFEIPFTVGPTKVIYADVDSPSGTPNGTTWSKAYPRLQDALAVAWSGDEIRVAQGTYNPDQGSIVIVGDRMASFALRAGVKLKGGYAGYGTFNPNARDSNLYPTILSGDLQGDDLWGILNRDNNSYHVVTSQGVSPAPLLDGFIIQSGQADGPYPHQCGGGLYVTAGWPAVVNCTFKSNTAVFGGAVANVLADSVLADCMLTGNRALVFGGGLYNQDGTVALTNALIVGNSADHAAVLGSSAIYNIGGSVILNDCTVADNTAPIGQAIVSLVWGSPVTDMITVANSILYNGAGEILSTDPAAVVVAYSDVKGGWSGTGNQDVDPRFVTPGLRSIEGEWIDGDYHLKSDSQCIDKGDKTLLPADAQDLDGDGNTGEALPVDLAGGPRVQGSQVDMGAYDQAASGPGPGPGPGWVAVTTLDITYDVPASPPSFPINVSGSGSSPVFTNFQAELKVEAAAASAAGGTWTAWFNPDPNPVGPGTVNVNFQIHGQGVNVSVLPPNTPDVKIATLTIYVRPAP